MVSSPPTSVPSALPLAVAASFSAASSFSDLARAVAAAASELGGGDVVFLGRFDMDDADVLIVNRVRSAEWQTGEIEQLRLPATAPFPIARAVAQCRVIVIEDNKALKVMRCDDPELQRVNPDDHACVTLPLIIGAERRVIGAVNFGFDQPRPLDEELLDALGVIGHLTGATLARVVDQERAERFAAAGAGIALVADGVIVADDDEIVRVWNDALTRLTGIRESSAIGKALGEVVPDWDRIRSYVHVSDPAQVLEPRVRIEPVPITLGGVDRWLNIEGLRAGRTTVYTVRDVTEEHQRARRLLEHVATISHQLRTPVAAMSGAALTLQRDDIELDPAVQRQLLELVTQGADRLSATVERILHAEVLLEPSGPAAVQSFDVRESVRKILGAVVPSERVGDLALQIDVDEDVRADQRAFEISLTNFVENAVKYSPGGGPLSVEVRVSSDLLLTVRDEGIGMTEDECEHAFEKFFRADPDMTRGIAGNGLGLHIVSQVVQRAGGVVSCTSRPGSGSVFTARLPASR